ncbi:restriction endonuclease subunit S [Flavobacterium sp. WC2416]|uniref:Restriction endonuclease subunit S n=1 Tax=Flavobacterium sp. WC2416 TaxID=3234141 RepID=A0AB39W937_9FLAO
MLKVLSNNYKETSFGDIPIEWDVKKLGDLGKVISGLTYSPDDICEETGTLVLRSSNVQDGQIKFDDNVFVKVNSGGYNQVQYNDILICVRNGSKSLIGKNALITKEATGMAFGAFMTIFRGEYNNYLYQVFNTDIYYREIHKNLGATINSINGSDLKEFKIPIPPLPEQQKIASILSTWDKAIEINKKILSDLEIIKKSMTINVLSGKNRFREFLKNNEISDKKGYKIPNDWEVISLSAVLEQIKNSVKPEKDKLYKQIGIRSHAKGIFYKEAVTGESLGNKSVFAVEPDCFMVNIVFAWEHAIAKTTTAELDMIVSHRFPMYKPLASKLDLDYLLFFFKSKKGKDLLGLASPGGAGRNKTLGQKEFLKLKIPLPSINEQKAIAIFLETYDLEIKLCKQKLEKLQLQKKGLMQQLLTGKIRTT